MKKNWQNAARLLRSKTDNNQVGVRYEPEDQIESPVSAYCYTTLLGVGSESTSSELGQTKEMQ